MTDRERIEALFHHKKPDRVPIHGFARGFCSLYTKNKIADLYNNPRISYSAQRKTADDFGWVFFPLFIYAAVGSWEFGGEIKWPAGEFAQAPMVARYPVEAVEDVEKLQVPDIKKSGIMPLMLEFYQLSARERLDNKPFEVTTFGVGPFTTAANICGLERFARWMIKEPQAVHRLMRKATDFIVEILYYWKDTGGIEGVLPRGGEPTTSNQVISPGQFEQFALPYIKEIHETALALGYKTIYMHVCGEQNANLPYWGQIPMGEPGIVSIGHEVELETAAHYFPDDIIMGNLEPALIQSGSPGDVYQASKHIVEKGKELPGGFIFGPGCELPPKAPLENIRAMNKAVDDCGWYR